MTAGKFLGVDGYFNNIFIIAQFLKKSRGGKAVLNKVDKKLCFNLLLYYAKMY